MPLGAVCLGEGHPQSSVSATVQLHSPIPISDPQVCRGGEPTEFSGTALDPLLGGILHSSDIPLCTRTPPYVGAVPRLFPDLGEDRW